MLFRSAHMRVGTVTSQAEPGLELRLKRVRRQIAAQHRHLKPIFQVLCDAVAARDPREARAAFENYRDAIEAHFSLEDEFFFPALHGLHREYARQLDALTREHEGFLRDVREIGEALRRADLPRANEALEAFAAALSAHEENEQRIVDAIRMDD
jgi:iron-sulfur cluster repair protein YtfE (RIC family)